jgi:hypothetical protein
MLNLQFCLWDKRLDQFICTEVTRTCDAAGLSEAKKCAGEITIVAEISGKWKLKTETNHLDNVANFSHAACDGRADIA